MWLSKAADSLNRVVRPASQVIHSVGLGVLVAMMLLTFADVALRYVFNRPIVGSFDLTEYMMAIFVSLGLAYCTIVRGNVRIDLVVSRLRQQRRAFLDVITCLLSLGLFSLIAWQCFVYVKLLFTSKLTSTVLLIPAFPFVAVVALGILVLCLVLLTNLLDFLSKAVGK